MTEKTTPDRRAGQDTPPSPAQGMARTRRSGLKPMASLMWRVAAPALRKRGLAEARIVTDWRDIVGPFLADATSPDGIKRGGAAGKSEGPGTLTVRVAGPVAIEVQHLAPQIIERVNAYFGYTAVDRLRIVQAPPVARKPRRRPRPEPDAATRRAVDEQVSGVEDDELRAALARLGVAIQARESEKR